MSRRPPLILRRRSSKIKPKLALTVFCEGKLTEPSYFREFSEEHGNMLVALDLRFPGAPMTLVEEAAAFKKRKRSRDSFDAYDQIWCVFDRDEHPNLDRAFDMARANGIFIAYSNPCFELWFILHVQDHDRPLGRHDLQSLCKKLVPGYSSSGRKCCDYKAIGVGYERAEERAERMNNRRVTERDDRGNPYTNVYELTRLIRANGKI